MSNSDAVPRRGGRATIELGSPVPGTEFTVLAPGFRPIAYGVDHLAVDVAPGTYQVVARAASAVDRRALTLVRGQRYRDLEVRLVFPAVAPLPGTTDANEAQAGLVADASRRVSDLGPSQAALVVLVRSSGGDIARRTAGQDEVTVLDSELQPLAGQAAAWYAPDGAGAAVWAGRLRPGGYSLRQVLGGDGGTVDRALWLSAGWQTIVFLAPAPAGWPPTTASIDMVRAGVPWDPGDRSASLAGEVLSFALRLGRGVVSAEAAAVALDDRSPRPILGLLAAQSRLLGGSGDLKHATSLIAHIGELMPDHPDVLATRWLAEEGLALHEGRQPDPAALGAIPQVSWPPMLSRSYLALIRLDAYRPGTVPGASVAERAAPTLLPDPLWTTWRAAPSPDELEERLGDAGEAWERSLAELADRAHSVAEDQLSEAAQRVADYLESVAELEDADRLAEPPPRVETRLATYLPSATVDRAVAELSALPPPPPAQPREDAAPRPRQETPFRRWPPTAGLSAILATVLVVGGFAGWQAQALVAGGAPPAPGASDAALEMLPRIEAPRLVQLGRALPGAPAEEPLPVRNTGTAPLTIVELRFARNDGSSFSVSVGDCTGAVEDGAECAMRVIFTPTGPGLHVAEFHIVSEETDRFTVVALGLGPEAGVGAIEAPEMINFGEIPLDEPALRDLTIRNAGDASLTGLSIEFVGDPGLAFGIVDGDCLGRSLEPEETCTMQLSFTAVDSALLVNELIVTSEQSPPHTVVLLGLGRQRQLVVFELPELDFGATPEAVREIGVIAGSRLQIRDALVASDSGVFTVVDDTCSGAELEAGGRCSVAVLFDPPSTEVFEGVLTLTVDGESFDLPLRGQGVFVIL